MNYGLYIYYLYAVYDQSSQPSMRYLFEIMILFSEEAGLCTPARGEGIALSIRGRLVENTTRPVVPSPLAGARETAF
jgi:hypothetical protein